MIAVAPAAHHQRARELGMPAWVWILAALARLEHDELAAAARDPHDTIAAHGFSSSEVMRSALAISANRSTIEIKHVRKVLDDMADDLLVEVERTDDGVALWRLLEPGRERLSLLVEAFANFKVRRSS